MKYKQGKLLEVFNEDKTKKVLIFKVLKKYRVVLYVKKLNSWKITKTREAPYKKYAERRFIELCFELKPNDKAIVSD